MDTTETQLRKEYIRAQIAYEAYLIRKQQEAEEQTYNEIKSEREREYQQYLIHRYSDDLDE